MKHKNCKVFKYIVILVLSMLFLCIFTSIAGNVPTAISKDVFVWFTYGKKFVEIKLPADYDTSEDPRNAKAFYVYDEDTGKLKGLFLRAILVNRVYSIREKDMSNKPPYFGLMFCYDNKFEKVYTFMYLYTGIIRFEFINTGILTRFMTYGLPYFTLKQDMTLIRVCKTNLTVQHCDDDFRAILLMMINYYDLKTKKFVYYTKENCDDILRYTYDPATGEYKYYKDVNCKEEVKLKGDQSTLYLVYYFNPFLVPLADALLGKKIRIITDLIDCEFVGINLARVLYGAYNTNLIDKNIHKSVQEIIRIIVENYIPEPAAEYLEQIAKYGDPYD